MKQNTKDWIQYISGASLIASAIVLAVTSLLQYERIAEGVNYRSSRNCGSIHEACFGDDILSPGWMCPMRRGDFGS